LGNTVLYFGQIRVTSTDADGDQISTTVSGTLVDSTGSKSVTIEVSNDDLEIFNFNTDSSSALKIEFGTLLDDGVDQTTLTPVEFKPSSSCTAV